MPYLMLVRQPQQHRRENKLLLLLRLRLLPRPLCVSWLMLAMARHAMASRSSVALAVPSAALEGCCHRCR